MKRLIGKVTVNLVVELENIDVELYDLAQSLGNNTSLNTKVQNIRKKIESIQGWLNAISYDLNGDK
ncbi:hypothetical protein [Acinetobacter phage vB_AbaS_TCUP2199]|nr:hypothetical protein [Acinetobacter phage vB_AbaS_TCUP2199]